MSDREGSSHESLAIKAAWKIMSTRQELSTFLVNLELINICLTYQKAYRWLLVIFGRARHGRVKPN